VIRDAVSAAGCQVSVRQVARAGELEATAAAAAAHAGALRGLLVAVGGDGTLNTVARAAMAPVSPSARSPGHLQLLWSLPRLPRRSGRGGGRGAGRPPAAGAGGPSTGVSFLVNASFGLYPRLLEDREAFKRQWGAAGWRPGARRC
jgi:diacylglycerol kinase family enzyme